MQYSQGSSSPFFYSELYGCAYPYRKRNILKNFLGREGKKSHALRICTMVNHDQLKRRNVPIPCIQKAALRHRWRENEIRCVHDGGYFWRSFSASAIARWASCCFRVSPRLRTDLDTRHTKTRRVDTSHDVHHHTTGQDKLKQPVIDK